MKNYKYKINGESYEVTIKSIDEGIAEVEVNGVTYRIENEEAPKTTRPVVKPRPAAATAAPAAKAAAPRASAPAGAGAPINSPLPGVILEVKVKEGDSVKMGQVLMVLEAMKMENNIEADRDGTIVSLPVKQGDSVMEGDVLVSIGE